MSYTAQVEALYVAYFNRPADGAGLNYWNAALAANGGNLGVVSSAFSTSSEYLAKYANMSAAQVVNTVYLNLFGHGADPAGLSYWSNLLGNGSLHIADIVTDVAGGAQGSDLTAYQNQITAASAFTAADQALAQDLSAIATTAGNSSQSANEILVGQQYLASVVSNPGGASGAALQTVLATNLANALNPTTLQAAVTAYEGSYIIPGHTTLTVDPPMSGTYDMSILNQFNAIDLAATTATSVSFTKVVPGTPLSIDTTMSATSVVYQTADSNGSTDSVNLTLGTSTGALGGYTTHPPATYVALTLGINGLTLEDANQNGIATVNVSSAAPTVNIIASLNDSSLSTLNVTGTAGLQIYGLTDNNASFTLNDATANNASAGTGLHNGTEIYNFDAPNLGTLNLQGAVYSTIWLNESQPSLAIADNGGGGEINWFAGVAGQSVNLSVSGSGVTNINPVFNQDATSFSVADTAGANVTIGTLSATAQPSNLAFTSETYDNTGTAKLTIQGDLSPHLATLTLTGNVVYDDFAVPVVPIVAPTLSASIWPAPSNLVTTGVTVSAGSDNLGAGLLLTGAAAGETDNITLGNGNNFIIDPSTAGTVNITAGTGANTIIVGQGSRDTTGTYNITLGTPAASPDQILVGTAGSHYASSTVNTVVTGASQGVLLEFSDTVSSSATLSATALANSATSAAAVTALVSAATSLGAHGVAYGVYGGNTYVVETQTGTPSASDTTIVELVGSHSLIAYGGYVAVVS
ncbi:MAG: DUF4214 domain-containing protein [Burkholderiaceae bacterium]|nr:DUF4214 domain-containing protein [Burkholderiaceae bacterium]